MFAYTSKQIVKSVGCRRISHLIYGNSARKYSLCHVVKSGRFQPLSCGSPKFFSVFKCGHTILKSSELHRLLRHGPVFSASVFKNIVSQRPYQTKSKDFNKEDDDNSEIENKAKNILDDLEFQSILKDFAKDFGVNDETNKFLEEIKQTHHSSFDDETEKPLSNTTCSSHQLDLKNGGESRTVSLPLCADKCQGIYDHKLATASHSEEVQDGSGGEEFFHIDQELEKSVEYDPERGKTGVYDIGQLVAVLKEENLLDICVIQVPEIFHYTDYLVLATAKSPRHCRAVMEFIIKLYKKKKNKTDPFVKWEGEKVPSWKALDMGNIILHIFLEETRHFYDIESLWLLDRKYDSLGSVKSDPQLEMMQHHLDFLKSLNPQ